MVLSFFRSDPAPAGFSFGAFQQPYASGVLSYGGVQGRRLSATGARHLQAAGTVLSRLSQSL